MIDKKKFPKRGRGIHQVRRLAAHKIAERQQTVSHHYVRGMTQVEIAKLVGTTQKTVSEDLKALRAKWLESALVDFNERKGIELAKIDAIESTAWEEFVKSQRPERVTSKTVKMALREKLEARLKTVQGVEDVKTDKGKRGRFKNAVNGKTIVAKMRAGDDPEREMTPIGETRETVKRGKGTGDPEWLRIIQWCVNQRCLMFGLTKPPDVNVNNNLNLIAWDSVHAPSEGRDEVEERIQEAEVLAISPSSAP